MAIETLKLPPFKLTDEEVRSLLSKAQNGDDVARDELFQGNLRLVASLVQRFSGRNEDLEDLFQIGSIGLMKAIERFDLSMDVKFSTYAVPVILGEIKQHLRSNGMLKVGRSLQDLAGKALRKREELSGSLGREPSVLELAAALDEDPSDVVDALEAVRPVASLYEKVANSDEDSAYLLDRVSADDGPEESSGLLDRLALEKAMTCLKSRERLVIELRYLSNLTQSQIAQRLGVSQVQVFRIERAALGKIREFLLPDN